VELFDTTQLALGAALRGATARQAALSDNLANVATPGYRRKDVNFHETLSAAMQDGGDTSAAGFTAQDDTAAPVRADGNSVDVDAENSAGRERARVRRDRQGRRDAHRHPQVRDGRRLMGLFDALGISGSGLTAQRMRMDVTAENLANAQSVGYKRKDVIVQQAPGDGGFGGALASAMGGSSTGGGGGVQVSQITVDNGPGRKVYDPSHPDADKNGYVTLPNVNPVTEMVDLIDSSRAYEANVTAMSTAKQMFTKTLDLLR